MENDAKDALVSACRSALRIPADYTGHDEEIEDLIGAARSALVAGGVSYEKATCDDDASVRVAIKTYVKANFGMDNPVDEKLMRSFDSILCRMAGSSEHGAKDGAR